MKRGSPVGWFSAGGLASASLYVMSHCGAGRWKKSHDSMLDTFDELSGEKALSYKARPSEW